jgi:hypothetical protein
MFSFPKALNNIWSLRYAVNIVKINAEIDIGNDHHHRHL